MQILNEGNISEKVLKILWLEQLPQSTREVIVTRDKDLETLAKLVDRNQEINEISTIQTIQEQASPSNEISSKSAN
ncbi:hypothetical protein GWI33_009282 [Rhynchophorus ferrugineus]|uniref:Uncharacterized protein n=1 Tax=Rhynchophorus ferrugineus TaxID=354439 RepID=A0A834IGU4_RHYFE|nr:hypothetical protein GWI33_009282 [Rhynchophorus ferrugineus]